MQKLKQAETLAEAYRQLFSTPEDEKLVVMSLKGRRDEACSRDCTNCPNYSEVCFPIPTHAQKVAWHQLMNDAFRGGS